MRHELFLDVIRSECAALLTAAATAGPEAKVPTCPKWTVARLVRHLARAQSWARSGLRHPDGQGVEAGVPPRTWDDLLAWWEEQVSGLVADLADPASPAWLPFVGAPQVAGSWARRHAHEAAIHRLDAEHARAASIDPDAVPALFEPEFAADGIEELIYWILPSRPSQVPASGSGTVLVHATDVGLTWTVRVEPDAPPEAERGGSSGETTIAGTADAVYRKLWGRPSHASVTGETGLLESLSAP